MTKAKKVVTADKKLGPMVKALKQEMKENNKKVKATKLKAAKQVESAKKVTEDTKVSNDSLTSLVDHDSGLPPKVKVTEFASCTVATALVDDILFEDQSQPFSLRFESLRVGTPFIIPSDEDFVYIKTSKGKALPIPLLKDSSGKGEAPRPKEIGLYNWVDVCNLEIAALIVLDKEPS